MAASAELARGLTLSAHPIAAQAVVTFPASPGITWVLTDIFAEANITTGNVPFGANIVVASGSFSQILSGLYVPTGSPAYTDSVANWSGQIPGILGQSLTVTINNTQALMAQFLTAGAFPI